jgi:hypothetical protein
MPTSPSAGVDSRSQPKGGTADRHKKSEDKENPTETPRRTRVRAKISLPRWFCVLCDLLFNRLPSVRAPGGDGDVGDAGDVGVSALRQQELLLRILNEPVYQRLKWFFAPGDTETDFLAEGANWNEGNTRRR